MSDVANSYTMPWAACSLWFSCTEVLKLEQGIGMGADKTFPNRLDPVQVLRLHQNRTQARDRFFRIGISKIHVVPKTQRKISHGKMQIVLCCGGKYLA